uniref:Uncharacterized protein n=1 Tax=Cucumis melo TaxID=3656 RepID=A0A9I9DTG1_CUCME
MVQNQLRTHQEALAGNQPAENVQNLQQEAHQRPKNQQQILQENQDSHQSPENLPGIQEPARDSKELITEVCSGLISFYTINICYLQS